MYFRLNQITFMFYNSKNFLAPLKVSAMLS